MASKKKEETSATPKPSKAKAKSKATTASWKSNSAKYPPLKPLRLYFYNESAAQQAEAGTFINRVEIVVPPVPPGGSSKPPCIELYDMVKALSPYINFPKSLQESWGQNNLDDLYPAEWLTLYYRLKPMIKWIYLDTKP
jgi:hypothetical protein